MPIVTLQHSFPYTNLDLENPLPNGGPINVGTQGGSTFANANTEGFIQQYTPQNPLFGIKQNGDKSTLFDIKRNSPLPQSFDKTNLDLENPLPNGGPIKVLAQGGTSILNTKAGFNQPYLPSKPLYDGGDTKLSDLQNSSPLSQTFADTGLDLIENNPIIVGPQGGTTEKNLKKGYTQTFTPFKTYLNNLNEDDSSYNTLFGTSFIYG